MSDDTKYNSDLQKEEYHQARKQTSRGSVLLSSPNDSSAIPNLELQPYKANEDNKRDNLLVSFAPTHSATGLPGTIIPEFTNEVDELKFDDANTSNKSAIQVPMYESRNMEDQNIPYRMKNERPPRRISSAKPIYSNFSQFQKNTDFDVLFDASKTSQNIIETLNKTRISDDTDEINFIPVDWLGVPLAPLTLPDFWSTTKMHYKKPDQSKVKEYAAKRPETARHRTLFDQFANLSWVPRDLTPHGIGNGHKGKHGVMKTLLPHPKTSVWNVPEIRLNKIRKNDPMEYINLLDPNNIISTEKAMYQWLSKDEGHVGLNISVGNSPVSSGFLSNQLPHLPLQENRDFISVYKKSFCIKPERNDIEGLAEPLQRHMNYPGYHGGASMRDVPSSFLRFAPNVLKSSPSFHDKKKLSLDRKVKSARPFIALVTEKDQYNYQ